MQKKFQELSIFEFQRRFPDEQSCYNYLASQKWPQGFKCEKCSHIKYCKGKNAESRQCTKCRYQSTPTSGTLFHGIKFSIHKAFYIIYYMSTNKKGISSAELSRKLALRTKTCWGFQQKVAEGMRTNQELPLEGNVEVDECVVGGQEEGVKGRKNIKKRLLVMGVERKGKGISRMYGQVCANAGSKELTRFFKKFIDTKAHIRTDMWRGYLPLRKSYCNLNQEKSGRKGGNFKEMHRAIMMIKSYIRGTHHAVGRLQAYVNQYIYRFNNRILCGDIFKDLVNRMVRCKPLTLSAIARRQAVLVSPEN